MPERIIYVTKRLAKWIEDKLPQEASTWQIEVSPLEQLAEMFDSFCRGDELAVDRSFRCLRPSLYGVWELKSADLRVFGWFPAKDCFIAVAGNLADAVKLHNLYRGYIGEVQHFRDGLPLGDPKFISGIDPNDVVSNFSLP